MSTDIFNPGTPELVVQNYFGLVQAIAKKIKRRLPAHVEIDDLVQTGIIGLLEASSRYDFPGGRFCELCKLAHYGRYPG